MKRPYVINALASDPSVAVGLTWDADVMYVYNPTKYTVLIRQGSNSRPASILDADIVCAPVSALALPVASREFFVTLTTPTLPVAPEGMPTSCNVMFMRDEPPVAFGSVPLAGQSNPVALVLKVQGDRNAGTFPNTDLVAVPTGISTLVLRMGASMSDPGANNPIVVTGSTSGRRYFELNAPSSGSYFSGTDGWVGTPTFATAVIRFDSEQDNAVSIVSRSVLNTDNGYTLLGYRERLQAGMYHSDGRLAINPYPPGQTYLTVVPFPGAFPVQASEPPLTISGSQLQVNPAATTVLVAATIPTTGDYMIEWEAGSTAPAAVGNYGMIAVSRAAFVGATVKAVFAYPGSRSGRIGRIPLLATDIVWLQTFGALGAGTQVFFGCQCYRIT